MLLFLSYNKNKSKIIITIIIFRRDHYWFIGKDSKAKMASQNIQKFKILAEYVCECPYEP